MQKNLKKKTTKAAEKLIQLDWVVQEAFEKNKKMEKIRKKKNGILQQQMVTKEKEEKKYEVATTNPFAHSKIRLTAA